MTAWSHLMAKSRAVGRPAALAQDLPLQPVAAGTIMAHLRRWARRGNHWLVADMLDEDEIRAAGDHLARFQPIKEMEEWVPSEDAAKEAADLSILAAR
jgi:hypothetical protein